MTEDSLTIIGAKIALLEQLVRALLKQEFMKASDPPKEAHDYAEHMKQLMEHGMRGGPHHPTTLLMTENIDVFFDALVRDIQADLGQPKS
jgi:hypothetical protein